MFWLGLDGDAPTGIAGFERAPGGGQPVPSGGWFEQAVGTGNVRRSGPVDGTEALVDLFE